MIIDTPLGSYRWIENWVTIPESEMGKINGRTHGVVVSKTGVVILFHQANPAVIIYSPSGELMDSWGDYPGAHGLTLVEENGVEYLWLTDEELAVAVKTTLTGEIKQTLPLPSHGLYETDRYVPTWVAVNEERFGGNGDIWLADGYGASLVHRFTAKGQQLQTLDGTEGAGRFACPHGIALDVRKGEPEILVADRGNKRIQVFAGDGTYRRTFGADYLISPDVCSPFGRNLIVPELTACVSIIDESDQLVERFGENNEAGTKKGWPDNREWIEEGKFNSPHGAVADAAGNIYVVEWVTGGRVTKLEKLS